MIPTRAIAEKCIALKSGEAISIHGKIAACMLPRKEVIIHEHLLLNNSISMDSPFIQTVIEIDEPNVKFVCQLSDIFVYNFDLLTSLPRFRNTPHFRDICYLSLCCDTHEWDACHLLVSLNDVVTIGRNCYLICSKAVRSLNSVVIRDVVFLNPLVL
jgi:hypothetical protein